ncbi:PQQ-binding-like beta-propeller repeat protein [Streptomyces sp. NPDC013171]|uniref:outer membrane protein assembly factor BamB family protein n=1 Tax=Streptomyces sp. NPDC013171 TaxID=3364863 RepID=UPI003686315E
MEALQAEIDADPDLRQQLQIHLSNSRSQNTGSVLIAGSTISRSQISLGPITVNNTRSGRLVLVLAGALILSLLALLVYGGVRVISSGGAPGGTVPGGTGAPSATVGRAGGAGTTVGQRLWAFPFEAGNAQLAFADGVVYIASDIVEYEDRPHLYAVNAATGQMAWSTALNGSILSTPVVSDGTVYIRSSDLQLGLDGRLYAIDAGSGRTLWDLPAPGFSFAGLTVGSGTVYAGSFTMHDGLREDFLFAFDAATGQVRWRFPVDEGVQEPVVSAGTVYFRVVSGSVYAIDITTRQQRWAFQTSSDSPVPPLVVAGGLVYAHATDGLHYLDAATGTPKAKFPVGSDGLSNSLSEHAGTIYTAVSGGSGYSSTLYAVDGRSGQQRWKLRTDRAVRSTMVPSDKAVYFSSGNDGPSVLHAVNPSSGRQLWTATLDGGFWRSAPVVSEEVVFVCAGEKSGKSTLIALKAR